VSAYRVSGRFVIADSLPTPATRRSQLSLQSTSSLAGLCQRATEKVTDPAFGAPR